MIYFRQLITHARTFCLCLLLAYTQNSATHDAARLITEKEGWHISSPTLNQKPRLRSKTFIHDEQTPLEFLQHVGEQAHVVWLNKNNSRDDIILFQEVFDPIDKEFLYELIEQILNDEALLKRVAQASYRNVTGFLKVVLAAGKGENAWKIRLHVWEQKEEKEFPHNHKWDFYSKIISGYLSQDIYAKSTAACDAQNLHSVREPVSLMPTSESGALPCPCRDNYILNPKALDAAIVSLTRESTDIIGNGESYMMPHHLIHAITPGKGSMSLVFTSEKITDNSEVFVPTHMLDTDLSRHAPSVTAEELKDELRKVQKMLRQLSVHEKYLPEMVDLDHHYYLMNGKDPILEAIHWRKELDAQAHRKSVIQLSKNDMLSYVVSADAHGNMRIDNKSIDPMRDYLFVLLDDIMYATPKDFHHESKALICHTSFSDYGPVDSAGLLRFDAQGNLTTIEAYSGHYCPSLVDMKAAQKHLAAIGIDLEKTVLSTYQDRVR